MANSLEKQELRDTLAAAATGDESAWRKIIDAYSYRVFALLKSKCGDEELSEEITQSTFCTVAAKLADYTESGKFVSWLFQIAVNRLRDEMRRRKRHAVPMENEMIGVLASGVKDPDLGEADETQLQIARLREAIRQLSSADQDIIHMRHSARAELQTNRRYPGRASGHGFSSSAQSIGKTENIYGICRQ